MRYWPSKVWDPQVGSTGFEEFCAALDRPLGHGDAARSSFVGYDADTEMVALPGGLNVPKVVYNYAQYIKEVGANPRMDPVTSFAHSCPRPARTSSRAARTTSPSTRWVPKSSSSPRISH